MSAVAPFPRQAQIEPFETFSFSRHYEVTPVEWLVEGWIPRRCAVLFTGPTKLGKTYILQHLFLCAALGKPWFGLPVAQVPSFGFFCEDEENWLFHRRNQILAHLGETPERLEQQATASARRGKTNWLMRFNRNSEQGETTRLWQQLTHYIIGEGYGTDGCRSLVGLDTARQVFDGNENAAHQVTQFANGVTGLAEAVDGAVFVTHHPPKSGESEFAGSGAWQATMRVHIHMGLPSYFNAETGEGKGERVLRLVANNYGAEGASIALKWDERAGMFLPNGDIVARASAGRTNLSRAEQAELEERMLIAARTLMADGAWIVADPQNRHSLAGRLKPTLGFKAFANHLQPAVDRMVTANKLVRITIGAGRSATVLLRPPEMHYPQER